MDDEEEDIDYIPGASEVEGIQAAITFLTQPQYEQVRRLPYAASLRLMEHLSSRYLCQPSLPRQRRGVRPWPSHFHLLRLPRAKRPQQGRRSLLARYRSLVQS